MAQFRATISGQRGELDENATNENASYAAARVAHNPAYLFAKHNGWGGRKRVSARDVRAALIAHGASTLTVELYASSIARRIRADFSDGRGA